jgi:predicted DNA-binding protein
LKNEKQINIFIPQEVADRLKEIANENYVTTTALIRRILIDYAKKEN